MKAILDLVVQKWIKLFFFKLYLSPFNIVSLIVDSQTVTKQIDHWTGIPPLCFLFSCDAAGFIDYSALQFHNLELTLSCGPNASPDSGWENSSWVEVAMDIFDVTLRIIEVLLSPLLLLLLLLLFFFFHSTDFSLPLPQLSFTSVFPSLPFFPLLPLFVFHTGAAAIFCRIILERESWSHPC